MNSRQTSALSSIKPMEFKIEEELPIVLLKEYVLSSHIKGYHAYMDIWLPKIGEFLDTRREPENEFDKYAIAVMQNNVVVGHLTKGRTGRFAKTVSFFLQASEDNKCKVEVIGKRVNLGDKEGLQIPCKLHFTGTCKFIDKLKRILSPLM